MVRTVPCKSILWTTTVRRREVGLFLVAVAAILAAPMCRGQATESTDGDASEKLSPLVPVRILVRNADEQEVAGAKVTPVGLRTKAERASHWSWSPKYHGPAPTVTTGQDGIAEITYPQFVSEKLETGDVTWQVDHEDYVVFRGDKSVDEDPAVITLQRGRRVAVAAVDAVTKEKITADLYGILSGSGFADEWKQLDNGMIMSRALNWDRRTLRIVNVPPRGAIRFSDPIDLDEHGQKLRVLLRDVELHRGTRLEGILDAAVPRPVVNGIVSVHVIVGTELQDYEGRNIWADWTKINVDGTFEFESLPRGAAVQMIAVCDGWVSSHPEQADLEKAEVHDDHAQLADTRVVPQVAALKDEVINITIKMEMTAQCRARVVDKDGKPVEGAQVMMWPNQIWFGGGSQILGDGYSLAASLRMSDEQKAIGWSWEVRQKWVELGVLSGGGDRYRTTTNSDGIAQIHTLPGGSPDKPRSESIHVQHDLFEQPAVDGLRRETTVALRRGETTEVTIRMDRKGTALLGE